MQNGGVLMACSMQLLGARGVSSPEQMQAITRALQQDEEEQLHEDDLQVSSDEGEWA